MIDLPMVWFQPRVAHDMGKSIAEVIGVLYPSVYDISRLNEEKGT